MSDDTPAAEQAQVARADLPAVEQSQKRIDDMLAFAKDYVTPPIRNLTELNQVFLESGRVAAAIGLNVKQFTAACYKLYDLVKFMIGGGSTMDRSMFAGMLQMEVGRMSQMHQTQPVAAEKVDGLVAEYVSALADSGKVKAVLIDGLKGKSAALPTEKASGSKVTEQAVTGAEQMDIDETPKSDDATNRETAGKSAADGEQSEQPSAPGFIPRPRGM